MISLFSFHLNFDGIIQFEISITKFQTKVENLQRMRKNIKTHTQAQIQQETSIYTTLVAVRCLLSE